MEKEELERRPLSPAAQSLLDNVKQHMMEEIEMAVDEVLYRFIVAIDNVLRKAAGDNNE
jgi:hypothetical protein